MKRLLLVLFICFPLMSHAQNVAKPGEPYEVYCEFSLGLKSATINIEDNYFKLLDENGEPIKFKDNLNLANYLSKRGWRLMEHEGSTVGKLLMVKMVKSDEEIFEHLNIEDKKKKE